MIDMGLFEGEQVATNLAFDKTEFVGMLVKKRPFCCSNVRQNRRATGIGKFLKQWFWLTTYRPYEAEIGLAAIRANGPEASRGATSS